LPAKCFVLCVLSLPWILSVFSRTVFIFLFCFRNFFAFSFLVNRNVFFGNFRIAISPTMSWGIFFDFFAMVWGSSLELKVFCKFFVTVVVFKLGRKI